MIEPLLAMFAALLCGASVMIALATELPTTR
jgi:hypothetical protein